MCRREREREKRREGKRREKREKERERRKKNICSLPRTNNNSKVNLKTGAFLSKINTEEEQKDEIGGEEREKAGAALLFFLSLCRHSFSFLLCRRRHRLSDALLFLLPSPKDLHRRGNSDRPPAQDDEDGVLLLPLGGLGRGEPGVGDFRLAVGVCVV